MLIFTTKKIKRMYSNVKIWKRKLKVIFPLLVIFIDNKSILRRFLFLFFYLKVNLFSLNHYTLVPVWMPEIAWKTSALTYITTVSLIIQGKFLNQGL